MKYLIPLFFILLLASCGELKTQFDEVKTQLLDKIKLDTILESVHFDKDLEYEAASLHYQNKPLLSIGQSVQSIDQTFSFRYDPNGLYQYDFNIIRDYLALDDDLSIDSKYGSINGIVFFSVEQEQEQIFALSGSWSIDLSITSDNQSEIIDLISQQLFPILKDKLQFEEGWKCQIDHPGFIEFFELKPPRDKGFWWTLSYTVELKH